MVVSSTVVLLYLVLELVAYLRTMYTIQKIFLRTRHVLRICSVETRSVPKLTSASIGRSVGLDQSRSDRNFRSRSTTLFKNLSTMHVERRVTFNIFRVEDML
jgi:hypothetical protein